MSDRALVIISEPIHPDAVIRLGAAAEVRQAPGFDEASLVACINQADALIMRGLGRVTRRVIDAAPRLRIIARHGTGIDHIDLAAARERGVIVTNTPDAMTGSVAEQTVALMLAVARRVAVGDRGLRAGDWGARERCWGMDLGGRTLGVAGMGRIGRRVAHICHHGLGMEVIYHDVQEAPKVPGLPMRRVPFEELLASADVLSLHVPLSDETHHLINRRTLALAKSGAILINASRGPVVDEAALAEALRSGHLAGAGLDVFEQEPVQGIHPLAAFENVVLTPHISSYTPDAMRRMAMGAAEAVLDVLAGREPQHRIV